MAAAGRARMRVLAMRGRAAIFEVANALLFSPTSLLFHNVRVNNPLLRRHSTFDSSTHFLSAVSATRVLVLLTEALNKHWC